MKRNIQNIENILNSFDGMQRAEAKPFFHTRVLARLEKEAASENTWISSRKPVWIIGVLSFLFLTNIFLILQQVKDSKKVPATETSSLQSFASEYHLNSTTHY